MTRATRTSRAVAAIAALGLFTETTAPIVLAAAQAGAKPPSTTQAPRRDSAGASAATAKPAAALPPIVDGGWPRIYDLPSGGHDPRLSAAGRELGQAEAPRRLSAPSRSAPRPATSRRSAPSSSKRTRSVAAAERLVSFEHMKIVEANFQTLGKDQVREITDQIDKVIPDDERIIALDRVLANLDKSQVIPKNVEGVKADPPAIFFSKTPAVIMNLDGEPIWSPIKENDSEVRGQHELGSVPARADEHLVSSQQRHPGSRRRTCKGPWSPAGKLPDSFKKLPAEDNWKDVKANLPGKPVAASAVPKVFVSLAAGGADSLDGRASVSSGAGHRAAVGQQHRERRLPDGTDGSRVLPRRGPLVHGDRLHRAVDVRDADLAGRLQEDSHSSTSARASSRRSPEPIRQSKPCSSRRFRRQLA